MDLERSDTFSLERAQTFGTYNQMTDEMDAGIIDEERVNWKVLFARIFAFFLLFVIIVCCGLGAITPRFLVLAAFICVLLIIVIIATYVDLRARFSSCWHMLTFSAAKPAQSSTGKNDIIFVHSQGGVPVANVRRSDTTELPSKASLAGRDTFSPFKPMQI